MLRCGKLNCARGLAFALKTSAFGMVFLVETTVYAYIFRNVIFF